jgi:hypothetical protein
MVEISSNIVYDGGRLIQFHGKLRKTNPIHESLRHILSMEAEDSSNIHNGGGELQAILLTPMAETLRNIYSDGRMPNPKSMEIELKFTMTAEDLNNIFKDGGTLYVNILDSAIQIRSSNCVAIYDNPLQPHLTLFYSSQLMIPPAIFIQGEATYNFQERTEMYSRAETAYNLHHQNGHSREVESMEVGTQERQIILEFTE